MNDGLESSDLVTKIKQSCVMGTWPILVAALLACWDCVGSNPTEAWISVSCACYVLSGRGLCVGLITRPEEPYHLWVV